MLGISAAQPSKLLPGVPPIAAQGLPGFETYTFNGLVGAAGTPPAVINKLSQELAVIARSPDIRERIIDDAGEPVGSVTAEPKLHVFGRFENASFSSLFLSFVFF